MIATAGGIVSNPETYALLLAARPIRSGSRRCRDEHMNRVMKQGDFRPMAQNREAMSDLVAILEARRDDYARAEAALDTSGKTVAQSLAALLALVAPYASDAAKVASASADATSGLRDMSELADQGFLDIGPMRLEYRMIGPRPDAAPTLVLLHEGLGCVGMWNDFPDRLAAATGAGVFVYSRAGYGQLEPGAPAAAADFHASGGARGAAAPARHHRFSPRSPGRPQRRRLDRRRFMPAACRITGCAGWC